MDNTTNKKIISTFKRANITVVPLKNLRDLICNKNSTVQQITNYMG